MQEARSSTTHDSPKKETVQMTVKSKTDTYKWYIYALKYYLAMSTNWNISTNNNRDGSHKVEQKNQHNRVHILHNSIYTSFQKETKLMYDGYFAIHCTEVPKGLLGWR